MSCLFIKQRVQLERKKPTCDWLLILISHFQLPSIWYCWWRWWCSPRWTSSRCWRWWRRRRSRRWRSRPEFGGGRPGKAGDPDIWNVNWIIVDVQPNFENSKKVKEKKENLYSGCVAFSSRQAVVTFQTLVWPENITLLHFSGCFLIFKVKMYISI